MDGQDGEIGGQDGATDKQDSAGRGKVAQWADELTNRWQNIFGLFWLLLSFWQVASVGNKLKLKRLVNLTETAETGRNRPETDLDESPGPGPDSSPNPLFDPVLSFVFWPAKKGSKSMF